ncbi:hypothetical protein QZH41_016199, partial [Actinostola sp. cb2023]
ITGLCFVIKVSDAKSSGFEPGMKVEAKDQTSSSDSYWVATVVMVSGPLLLLRFDGYDEDRSGDFWFDCACELIQPIGWCAKTNTILIPPEAIRHKKPNWAKFLMENLRNAVAAPDHLFHDRPDDDNSNNGHLKVGSNIEVQDGEDPLCYWSAVIIEKYGLRLRLRYVGYEDEMSDIWEYYYSDRVHNVGWCKNMGMMLKPPKVMDKYKLWLSYRELVKLCQKGKSYQHLSKEDKLPVNNGFKKGMKLEAVNPEDTSVICVATVKDILNDCFFAVEIDCVVTINIPIKFVCHSKSKYLYPVGWCEKNRVPLKPPRGFSTSTTFSWDKYLDVTQAKAVPESLFNENLNKQRIKPHFVTGQLVEVLHQDDPSYYWIAEVTGITLGIKYQLRLKETQYTFVELVYRYHSSEAVHGLGWGKKMGLTLKPPKGTIMKKGWMKEILLLDEISTDENTANCSILQKLEKTDNLPPPHGFEPGMQLEAVNLQDPSSICVASVIECNNEHYFTVQIDNSLESSDDSKIRFWCHGESKKIFPIGWCKKNNIQLTPPPGYSNKEFVWQVYMESNNTKPAPEHLFCQVNLIAICKENGDKSLSNLNSNACADKMYTCCGDDDDGNDDGVGVGVGDDDDDDSGDDDVGDDKELLIFVRNSCSCGPYIDKQKLATMPNMLGPAPPNAVLKLVVEKVVLCAYSRSKVLDVLSTEKEKQSFLSILKTLTSKLSICENLFSLNKVNACSSCDKDSSSTTKSPVKSPPPTFAKPSSTTIGLPNSTTKLITPTSNNKPTTTKLITPTTNNKPTTTKLITPTTSKTTTTNTITPTKSPNPLQTSGQSSSTVLNNNVVGKIPEKHISKWSIDEVVEFVTPRDCKKFATVFQEQEVDGKALMLLSLDDIHKVLGVTLGPAIKLHDDVQKLRIRKH